jgi:putative ABC transport system substrate-binding protein
VRLADAFRQGLREGGYVEGRNVTIAYRWADGQFARLPELAADLVHRRVSLIVATGGTVSARAAKEATATIPILFIVGPNPIGDGLVTSLNRPGGNATGVALYTSELLPKRLELLGELLPRAATIALLVNPSDAAHELETKDVEDAMRVTGQQMVLLKASAEGDFEPSLVSAVRQRADALLVSANPFFTGRRAQLVALAARHVMPAGYPWREYADAGGLMSYGPSIAGALIGSLGVFVQGAGFILLNPDADQLTRDIMPLGKRVQALPGNEFLRDLPLERDAVGALSGHGFHPLKAQLTLSNH